MIEDFRQADSGAFFEADVCIVGGGAAGLTIATEFVGTRTRVCVLESGGFNLEMPIENLYEIENTGLPRSPQVVSRLRYFGGSTNMWAGRCAPLTELDFSHRDWVDHSGWPIEHASLKPYYLRANGVLGLGPNIYDNRLWKVLDELRPEPFHEGKLKTQFWQFSSSPTNPKDPVRFGRDFRAELEKADNIRVLLHANLVKMDASGEGQHVSGLEISTLEGIRGRVKAKQYVLACGGIENSRLLLAAQDDVPLGLGNEHDQVGRYFMEHPRGTCATAVGEGDELEAIQKRCSHHWYDDKHGRRHVYLAGIGASDQLQREVKILNCDVSIVTTEDADSGTLAAERLIKGQSADSAEDAFRVIKDLGEVTGNAVRRYMQHRPPIVAAKSLDFECHIEQAPNPDSRISLSREKDALGMPRSKVNWVLSEQEHQSIKTFSMNLATELARLKLGRIKLADWVLEDGAGWTRGVQDVAHHMGGTRMSESPQNGVVNTDCRLHSTDNLFVAGSSVFPTSGCVNPTLTITALSLRLADHLKERLKA
ncbi:MAG: GMC oxidoreductase [bacterium]